MGKHIRVVHVERRPVLAMLIFLLLPEGKEVAWVSDLFLNYNIYHYHWSNNDTTYQTEISNPGTYTLTVTSGLSCVGGTTSIIIPSSNPPNQPTIQANSNYLACNTSNNVTYQWNFNGIPLLNDTLQILYADSTGYYSVTIFDITTGCFSTSVPVFIAVGIDNVFSINSFKIFPIPTNNLLNIRFVLANSHKEVLIEILNSIGQTMISDITYDVSSGTYLNTLNIDNINDGFYLLKITLDNNITINRKIVIQK